MNSKNYFAGAVGGLAGGLVFGMMMTVMGMMPLIASLAHSTSVAVGWVIHLVISVVIGLFFSWWFGSSVDSYATGLGWGILHGFIWWILGPLTIMPVMMGMGVQYTHMFAKMNMLSLMGHLIYGLLLGLTYYAVAKSDGAQVHS